LGLPKSSNGAIDLQTTAANETNNEYPDPTNLKFVVDGTANYARYFSVAADADLDGSGHIESNEWYPYHYTPFTPVNGAVANEMYNFLGTVQNVHVGTIALFGKTVPLVPRFPSTLVFQNNDLLVTVASARFDGFIPIQASPNSYFGANHKTVGSPLVGQAVIPNIQSAQPLQ